MSETLNVLESAQLRVKRACDALDLEPAIYELLKEQKRFIEISIPVKMDDGSLKVFKGYRAAHNDAIGPCKGGIRFDAGVHAEEVKALSLWMTFKAGALGLPYGGGKGGVAVDPRTLSEREYEQVARGYVRGLHKYLGEKIDIPAPDVGTNPQVMAWMTDEYIKLNGDNMEIGVFTGKPLEIGGSEGRLAATGFGIGLIAKLMAEKIGLDFTKATAAIQGFGNAGEFTAKSFEGFGAKIVAVSEWDPKEGTYALYNKDGLKYEELSAYKAEHKSLLGFPNAEKISEDEFWEGTYDIIAPCALENSITAERAEKLNVKMVAEAANGPTTVDADDILKERGIPVTPDLLTNSGGVLVSYYEWVQNLQGYYWTLEEVEEKQTADMTKAFNNIYNLAQEYNVTLREAVYMFPIREIAKAMKIRGWY